MNKNDENYQNNTTARARSLWPRTIFAETTTIEQQIAHILEEIDEVAVELDILRLVKAEELAQLNLDDLLPAMRELADVQASIGTLWDVVDRIFGSGTAEKLVLQWVEDKNRVRGYYQVEGEGR